MLRSGVLVPLVYNVVVREGVEFIIRSPEIVEEDSTIFVLQDRLELLLGRFLVDRLDGKVIFAGDVVLVLPLVNPIGVAGPSPAPTPAWTLFLLRPFSGAVPPTAPTPTLATFRATASVKFVQSVLRHASIKHDRIPDVL